jgi:hypothetical protein
MDPVLYLQTACMSFQARVRKRDLFGNAAVNDGSSAVFSVWHNLTSKANDSMTVTKNVRSSDDNHHEFEIALSGYLI